MKWMKVQNKKDATFAGKIHDNLHSEHKACADKIDSLIDMRASHEITAEEFQNRKSKLLKDKLRLEELLTDAGDNMEKRLERAEHFFNLARDASDTIQNGTLEARKKILADLGSNLTIKDRILSIDIEKPLLALKEVAKEVKTIHDRLEPTKKPRKQRDLENLYSKNPRVLGDRESNPN